MNGGTPADTSASRMNDRCTQFSRQRYRFGPFELQLDVRRLLKEGAPISLRSTVKSPLSASVADNE